MSKPPEQFEYEKKPQRCDYENECGWRRTAKKFFQNSSFNGALYIFASESWIKRIFWGIILFLSLGGFIAITTYDIVKLA